MGINEARSRVTEEDHIALTFLYDVAVFEALDLFARRKINAETLSEELIILRRLAERRVQKA